MKQTNNLKKTIALYNISFILCALFCWQNTWALEVDSAVLMGDVVKVSGHDAAPFAIISWGRQVGIDMEEVTQADRNGRFRFKSDILPNAPRCSGELVENDNYAFSVQVEVDNCRGEIEKFYSAPQDVSEVAPGEFDSVRSDCDLGDYVVAGQVYISSIGTSEVSYDKFSSGPVIDSMTEQQSWVLLVSNTGSDSLDIRVSARCAHVLPPR